MKTMKSIFMGPVIIIQGFYEYWFYKSKSGNRERTYELVYTLSGLDFLSGFMDSGY